MLSLDKPLYLLFLALLLVLAIRTDASRAGIIRAGFPGENASVIDTLAREVQGAGYEVVSVDANTLCDSARLAAQNLDLLVLPNAAALPATSVQAVGDYARSGADIIALNAPLYQRLLVDVDGKWTNQEDYQRANAAVLPKNVLFDFGSTDGWERTSDKPESKAAYAAVADGPAPGQRAIHSVIEHLTGWDNFGIRGLDKPFPTGHRLTVFSAKGGPDTKQLAIEWSEKDGSRWIAVVALAPEWRQYVLTPRDFKYWTSVEGRGGRGDSFKPENAATFSFGLAFSHTGFEEGRHEFWMGPVGTADNMPELGSVIGPFDLPALDTLCPGYKFFDAHGVTKLSVRKDQAMVSAQGAAQKWTLDHRLQSPQPRPTGAGFDKRRDWRWIPLMEARTAKGEWRGTPATMMINAAGSYKGGVWASFGYAGNLVASDEAGLAAIRRIAQRMRNGVFILDGGANFYTYFDDQDVKLGMRAVNIGKTARANLIARVVVTSDLLKKPPVLKHWKLALQPGEIKSLSGTWRPANWPSGGYTVLAELLQDGMVIDSVTHKINVWRPKKAKHFVTIKNGEFMLNGKLWRAHGVNYMPSSGIGIEDGEYFEHWIGAKSYHPEVIDRDLDHIKKMGMNSVAIFIYTGYEKDQNLLDILRRLELRGMKANVSLRPGMPSWWKWENIRQIIEKMRLAQNDTVFAYDIAWEPMFNTHNDRAIYDRDWENWIIERYGSIEAAEQEWGYAVPRDETGKTTNPYPQHIDSDGKWRKMTAAYRKFLDTVLYKQYSVPRRQIRTIDPNHYVSFRMAEAGNPTYHWDGRIPYDFPYLAAAVDILEPEAYGRIGDWEKVKPGWFQVAYAKWAAPEKPVIWAEMGYNTWDLARMQDSPKKLDFQAMFHQAWYRMLISSGANGIYFWWYPGGFRYGENSDYGIINPDGTDKPVTKVIRANAAKFLNAPARKKPDYWITIDRDQHPDGAAGIYDAVKSEFWAAADGGKMPGLRTAGTGSDSSDAPIEYLDAVFDSVQVRNAQGKWVDVPKGSSVNVASGKPVMAKVTFTNLGEAKLLAASGASAEPGTVFIAALPAGFKAPALQPISRSVPSRGTLSQDAEVLANAPSEAVEITLSLRRGAGTFGERFSFTVEPAD